MLFTGSIYWGTVSGCIKYTLRKEKNEKSKAWNLSGGR